jgi:hypothetical protein
MHLVGFYYKNWYRLFGEKTKVLPLLGNEGRNQVITQTPLSRLILKLKSK